MQIQFLGRLLQTATIRIREKEKDETEEKDGSNIRADDDDDMSGDEQHDDDAVARKARARKDEENDYEGEEEEKEEVGEYESGERLDLLVSFGHMLTLEAASFKVSLGKSYNCFVIGGDQSADIIDVDYVLA